MEIEHANALYDWQPGHELNTVELRDKSNKLRLANHPDKNKQNEPRKRKHDSELRAMQRKPWLSLHVAEEELKTPYFQIVVHEGKADTMDWLARMRAQRAGKAKAEKEIEVA